VEHFMPRIHDKPAYLSQSVADGDSVKADRTCSSHQEHEHEHDDCEHQCDDCPNLKPDQLNGESLMDVTMREIFGL
jgi:hypothetical protein